MIDVASTTAACLDPAAVQRGEQNIKTLELIHINYKQPIPHKTKTIDQSITYTFSLCPKCQSKHHVFI